MGLRTPEDRYDEFHPMPGAIVHYWPRDQAEGGEPLAAIVVNTGRGYGGPHLMILSAAADGYRFESAVPYGAEFGPAEAGSWTWPGGRPMDGEQRPAPKDATVKLPIEWATERGYVITDPDGWRGADGRPFDEPVDELTFIRRASSCTLAPLSSLSGQVLFSNALERSNLDPERAAALLETARACNTGRPERMTPLSTTVIAEFGGKLYLAARQVAVTAKHRSMERIAATLSCSCGASVEWGSSGVLLHRYYFNDAITTGNQLMIACATADEPLCEHWTPLPLTLTPRTDDGLADEKYVALDME